MAIGFILLGFSKLGQYQMFLCPLFLLFYVITLGGNASIILTYKLSPNLHTPMYFYLANLSFLEIFYVTSTIPKALNDLLSNGSAISFYGCAVQMYCVLLLGGTECYVLAAMAYDRYNAICQPLLYTNIMNRITCIKHIIGSWSIGAINSLIHTALTFSLPFCRSNQINHFFCDVPPLLALSCKDTWVNEWTVFGVASFVIIGSCILTIFSYIKIISAVLQVRSSSGRKKAFSTCTSHLIVVAMFYGSAIFMYFRPKSSYGNTYDRLVSLMYTVLAPLCNPFIYALRNKEVKSAITRLLCKRWRP
ncbi:olfactory receptor 5V1-like [Pyxicephalus adspersus]